MPLKYLALTAILSASVAAHSDDTEIFSGVDSNTNMLFILDASGSMQHYDGTGASRLSRMKTAMHLLIDQLYGVNIALMRFYKRDRDTDVQLIAEMQPVQSNRSSLKTAVTNIPLGKAVRGGTPSVAAMYEAKKYFLGEAPYRGTTPNGRPTYQSPVQHQCDSNHIIFLTDGAATEDHRAVAHIKSALLGSCAREPRDEGTCGVELAEHLASVDQFANLPGVNTINTHSIGFNISSAWATDVATAGGGLYREAASTNELLQAFNSIINNISTLDNTFTPPAITIDPRDPLSNREDVYLTLFQPSNLPSWRGNLKRYRLYGQPPSLQDATDQIAIDPDSGGLAAEARSYWSSVVDGNNVGLGGAASLISANGRVVVSNIGQQPDLTLTFNRVAESNDAITADMLGVANDTIRDEVLKWARGVDVHDSDHDGMSNDSRTQIADPLHSKPIVVNYSPGTQDSPDSVVYFGTNDGYLHAIDAASGNELFAYVPRELLPKLAQAHVNSGDAGAKLYGVDGEIAVWRHDANKDRQIVENHGDHVYLYTGLRRGGRHYYALDVTDKNSPRHLWTILGGSGDFTELGQSWAKPVLGKIKLNGTTIPVLVISGGYDPDQDNHTVRTTDDIGRAVYIVNATTGALIWQASAGGDADLSIDAMQYSIPASPAVVDINGDKLIDQIYVGDMGGQLFRFDLNPEASTAANLATGGVIAELAGPDASDNRRFYNSPDVALIEYKKHPALAVSIGSGYRAHPLATGVDDRFYSIRQPIANPDHQYGFFSSGSWRTITEANIFDTTDNTIQLGDDSARAAALNALNHAKGWLIKLDAGEKNLAPSLTVNRQVIFTSYVPDTTTNTCGARLGSSRAYAVDIADGTPVFEQNSDEPGAVQNRYITLKRAGISPPPVPFFSPQPNLLVGVEALPDIDFGDLIRRVYWSEQAEI